MPKSLQSLDTISVSSEGSYDSEDEDLIAEQEWQDSIHQLQQIVSIVLLPSIGKWLGRKWSHWVFARYVKLGLGTTFFFGGGQQRHAQRS